VKANLEDGKIVVKTYLLKLYIYREIKISLEKYENNGEE
jgi:hypothetical protein